MVEVDIEGATGRAWTYKQLLDDSEKLAFALSSRFSPGERLVIYAPSVPKWLLMEYACALCGVVLVTANPAYQEKELRFILEQSGAVGLFHTDSFRGNPLTKIARQAAAGLDVVREIVDIHDNEALHRTGKRDIGLPEVKPGDAVMIQYTSGTTGFPKGAVLTHRGLVNNARFYAGRLGVCGDSVWANIMPLFHTAGCGMVSLGCLQAGCKMLLIPVFDPSVVTQLIEREKVTTILGVPTMMVALIDALEQETQNMASVKMISSGGSMVAPDLVRKIKIVFGCDFGTVYGQTETSPVITQHHHDDTMDDICTTIGQPLPQTSVAIRSIADNHVVPLDTVGEICVKGYCNMIGYHANPKATAQAVDPQGWLHTGDLGTMDARGFLRITGRVKDMIIRGGENLFPAEIENVLLEHPSVTEVSVVGLPDDKWGEVVACFIRSESTDALDPAELHAYCRERLAPQKTPTVWCAVDAFPLTGSGKIQKFSLREGYLAGQYQPLINE